MSKPDLASKRNSSKKSTKSKKNASAAQILDEMAESESIEAERFLENVAQLQGSTKAEITFDKVASKNRHSFEAFVARWPDFAAFRRCAPIPDKTRVIVPPLSPGGSDFVQAQHLLLNKKAYILAQAPLKTTISDFWRMVYHEEPMAIVVVLHKDEMCDDSGKKAPFFWPTNVGDSKTYHNSSIIVTLDTKNEDKSGSAARYDIILSVSDALYSKMRFEDADEKSSERQYKLFHYSSWAEGGTTDPTDLANFIKRKVLNSLGRPQDNDTPTNPLLIVSLNGLNRAPAICGLVEVAWSCELKTHRFDLVALAEKLSNQRPGAITDVHSYLTFFATSFRLASLYSMGNAQELDAVVKNLMKPLPSDVLGKVTKTQGSLEETAEEDSMDHFDKEASSKSKKKSFIESVDVPL